MKSRRQFLKTSAGAAALGAFSTAFTQAEPASGKSRRVWVLSDLHSGLDADGKDGAEWFGLACDDVREGAFDIDYAMTLGDITHGGAEAELAQYLETRKKSGVDTWHEIAGNHEYHAGAADAFKRLIRDTKPYSVIDGGIAWFFLSDEAPGVPGELTEESCQWLEEQLAEHAGKTTIVCSHQLVKGTVFRSDQPQRHIHPAERVAGIISKSKIDLWMCGHEHHTPYGKEHIVRKDGTTYINVASMSHAYGTGQSQSCLLDFHAGATEITARRRNHDGRAFLPEFEVRIPLRQPLEL